ncbi:MAG: sigma-54 dependent transcriptional regulator [Pseudomonadota bacterium]
MTDSLKKILLVDDEDKLLNSMAQRVALLGFEPLKASSFISALEIAKTTHLDLAVVDLNMPDMDGLVTITKLKEIIPDLRTVLLTGYGNEKIKQATEALGSMYYEKDSMGGLWDVIKRFGSQDRVIKDRSHFQAAGSQSQDRFGSGRNDGQGDYYDQGKDQVQFRGYGDSPDMRPGDLPKIIGETPELQRLRKNIKRLSELDCPIIIRGETGTGKELSARIIHKLSHRKNQRFLAFDCGCFSNDFRFSELVGCTEELSTRFTSTKSSEQEKNILFSGTVFLDHFENMPVQTQEQMMQILDSRATARSAGPSVMDIRFIAATHQDLKSRVAEGRFSEELYNRINTIELYLPALRERRDDIPPLCSYFITEFNKEFKKGIESVTDEVFSIFRSYAFPGNVRELKHIIERAVILSENRRIEPRHLPDRLSESVLPSLPDGDVNFPTLSQMERMHILRALEITKGNRSKAAEVLGISRAALWRKIKLINE